MSDTSPQDFDDMISDEEIDIAMDYNEGNDSRNDKSSHDFSYEVLTIDDIVKKMNQSIEQIRTVISLPSATIRTLLKHFKWDVQKLLEKLFDSNRDRLFTEVGIATKAEKKETKKQKSKRSKEATDCLICYMCVAIDQMFGLDCGHFYCRECWRQYLTTKIASEGVAVIACPQTECKVIIDDDQISDICKDPVIRAKYQRLATDSFVECCPSLRWCPKPDCFHVFSARSTEPYPVTCVCGTIVCFLCVQPNHQPIGCDLLRAWNTKSAGNNPEKIDGKTANWIISNTKECPKCRTSIEKNGGCNHMTCRSIKCKYEFCWVCLESWSTHGTSYYNCNLYNENKAKTIKDGQSDQRKALERFMFYWTRFMNHKQSLKFENELKSTVKTKMAQLQDKLQMAWVEVQFMEQAVQVLCECRQTLMFTYVFAYYNQRTSQLNIFEDNQRDLQKAVEQLSEYLEQDLDVEEDKDIRLKVLHSSNYCQNRRKALIEHIIEGNEKDWWKYDLGQ